MQLNELDQDYGDMSEKNGEDKSEDSDDNYSNASSVDYHIEQIDRFIPVVDND